MTVVTERHLFKVIKVQNVDAESVLMTIPQLDAVCVVNLMKEVLLYQRDFLNSSLRSRG